MAASSPRKDAPPRPTLRFRDVLGVLSAPRGLIAALLLGESFALLLSLSPGLGGDPLVYFGLASLIVQWTLLGFLATCHLLREPLSRLPLEWAIWSVPPILVVVAGAVGGTGLVLLEWAMGSHPPGLHVAQLMAMALISGIVGAALLGATLRTQEQRARAERAEMEALRARVRPHFLFNTLNTALSLLPERAQDAERVLLALGDLFRAALSGDQEWPASEEVALTRAYLDIEQARMGERLNVEWHLDRMVGAWHVPKLLLQGLVENAIHHGVQPSSGRANVRIEVEVVDHTLVMSVENTLPPPGKTMSTHHGHRVGLAAAEARLASMIPAPGTLFIERDAECFRVTVRVPSGQPTTR